MMFVDVGAYNGDTVEQFFKMGHLIGDPKKFKIYAFEPNPEHQKALRELQIIRPNLTVSDKAAWTNNGTIKFTVDDIGSTVMRSKKNWGKGTIIEVECFDFSEWIRKNADDFVIVKMDCEGAEFPILEKLIEDDTIRLIDMLWVEMHPNKVTDYTTTYKNNLVAQLKQLTDFQEWH